MGPAETASGVRVGVRTRNLSGDRLRFIRQIGATDIFVDHADTDEEPDEFNDQIAEFTVAVGRNTIPSVKELRKAKDHVEDHGLRLTGIQSIPHSLYGDIMYGNEGKHQAVNQIKTLIRNLGKADVSILGYQWNPRGVVPMRTSPVSVRGGASATAFNYDELEDPHELADGIEREYTEEEFWNNYEWFLQEVLPVAEEADVDLALHPVDPPSIESLGGIPRLFRNAENFETAMDMVPSDKHGLKLCLGCFSQMGEDIPSIIRRFTSSDDIKFIHFRDVVGTMPQFHETFVDEGNFDPVEVIRVLEEVGYDGVVIPDHVPEIEGDDDWRHRSRAYTVGYLNGVIDSVETE